MFYFSAISSFRRAWTTRPSRFDVTSIFRSAMPRVPTTGYLWNVSHDVRRIDHSGDERCLIDHLVGGLGQDELAIRILGDLLELLLGFLKIGLMGF